MPEPVHRTVPNRHFPEADPNRTEPSFRASSESEPVRPNPNRRASMLIDEKMPTKPFYLVYLSNFQRCLPGPPPPHLKVEYEYILTARSILLLTSCAHFTFPALPFLYVYMSWPTKKETFEGTFENVSYNTVVSRTKLQER